MKRKIPEEERKFGLSLRHDLILDEGDLESVEVRVSRSSESIGRRVVILTVHAPGIKDQLIDIAKDEDVQLVDRVHKLQIPTIIEPR